MAGIHGGCNLRDGETASRLRPSKFFKVMCISDQEELGLGQHVGEERFMRRFRDELGHGKYLGTDLAAEGIRRGKCQFHDFPEADVANEHEIDVAAAGRAPLGHRSEYERHAQSMRENATNTTSPKR